ncbi:MAG: 50S ribosomal protein L28 [Patescibacteria group bacterium]|nr:50S ribosomal protein L28 [Patescibacteria group bacterium]
MSRICQICQRGTRVKISRSHSNIATKKRQYLNLKKKKIGKRKIKICTRCLKAKSKIKITKNRGVAQLV